MRILVTGATGFVGGALVRRCLREPGVEVVAAVRGHHALPSSVPVFEVGDLSAETKWASAVHEIDAIVHTAARVHVTKDMADYAQYRRANVDATLALARRAAGAGVRRFVFLSSIKVNGDSTAHRAPFTAADAPAPRGSYAVSKHEAEVGLRDIGAAAGMDIVCIRPTLVYGPGVKANFRSLMRLIATGVPLPFGAVANRRSFVAIGNLVDLMMTVLAYPAALNGTFLVSDGEDLSLPDLIRRLARGMERPARLLPVPEALLRGIASAFRRHDMVEKLLDSLQVDIADNQRLLGWSPPFSSVDCLRDTGRWYTSLRGR